MFDNGVILLAQFSVGDYRFFDILLVHHELGFTAPEMYSCLEDFPKSTNCFLGTFTRIFRRIVSTACVLWYEKLQNSYPTPLRR